MPYQLHTRAGLAPPFSTTRKRLITTGSGGGGAGSSAIADGFTAASVVIELETVLGEYNTAQSASFNYLMHSHITNTSGATYAGIHWMADGKIRVAAGGTAANRTLLSTASYATGDFVKIRWELSFASVSTSLVGTQTLYINDVLQGSGSANSGAFGTSAARFALNSVCANDSTTQEERITDQYLRRFYILYTGGTAYEREWIFDRSTGFEVPNSANATVDPVRLFGGNGINVLGQDWPEDNSQWDLYSSGSTEQITSSGGIASALAGGAASTQIINEHVLSASGIAAAVASGIASTSVVNEQVNSTGGIASAIASAIASTGVINEQVVSSGGIAAAIAGATASTQVINEQTSEQIVSSGGIAASIGSASASTQIISEQVVSSGGVAGALAGVTASSEQVNEQIIISGGQANAYASGFASTQIVNEQNSEQIITTGGASSALASATASTQFISEQIISTGGIAQAFASGVLSSLVINRTSEPLAPERMSATRLMPAITAQHIVPAITGSRLINNISAQRV